MDRGALRVTVHGIARVGLDLATKPPELLGSQGASPVSIHHCLRAAPNSRNASALRASTVHRPTMLISRKKKSSDRDIQAFLLKYFLHKVLRASAWAPRASAILNIYVLIYECPSFQLDLTRYVCFANRHIHRS